LYLHTGVRAAVRTDKGADKGGSQTTKAKKTTGTAVFWWASRRLHYSCETHTHKHTKKISWFQKETRTAVRGWALWRLHYSCDTPTHTHTPHTHTLTHTHTHSLSLSFFHTLTEVLLFRCVCARVCVCMRERERRIHTQEGNVRCGKDGKEKRYLPKYMFITWMFMHIQIYAFKYL